MKRKTIFLITLIILVFSMSACGDSSEDYSETGQTYSSVDDIGEENSSDVDDDYVPTPIDDFSYQLKEIEKNPPQLFMREADLAKTTLGKPDKIEKCTDFDSLEKGRKSKEYIWGSHKDKNLWKVTVRYERSTDGSVDNYETYPDDNGYVAELFFFNPETGVYETKDML